MGFLYAILGAIPCAILSVILKNIVDRYKIADKWYNFHKTISESDNVFMKILSVIISILVIIIVICSFIFTLGSFFLFTFIQHGNWLYYIIGTLICSLAELISFNIMD